MGLVLGLSALTLMALIVFSNGKAVPEESPGYHEGTRGYMYSLHTDKVKAGSLIRAKQKSGYYNPQIDGQPIHIPQIADEMQKIIKTHLKRIKNPVHQSVEKFGSIDFNEFTNNDDTNGEYYENPVVLNSMSKNIYNKIYEDKAQCPNCHSDSEYDKINLNGLNPAVHEDPKSKDATENFLLNSYRKGESIGSRLFESSENPKQFQSSNPYEDGAPEVVGVINKNMHENAIIETVPDSEYDRPIVREVLTKKISETSAKQNKGNGHYTSPAITQNLKRAKNDKYDETWSELLPIARSGYTTEPAIIKTSDKKIIHKASSSGSQGVNYYTDILQTSNKLQRDMSKDEAEIVPKTDEFSNLNTPLLGTETKKLNKNKRKKCSKIKSARTNIDQSCMKNQPESLTEKTEVNEHTPETVSKKPKYSIVKYEYYPEGDDIGKNGEGKESLASSTLETPVEKSSYENLYGILDTFSEDQSTELPDFEHINIKEPFNIPHEVKNQFFDSLGSGENTLDFPQSLDIGQLRSLSWLNSNIWPLIFNPNAKEHELNKCFTRNNDTGYCTYLQNCPVPNIATSLEQLLSHACVLDEVFIGVCCPEFPVETVQVHWEQDLENSGGEKMEDKLSHDIYTEDCGTRSEAFGTPSWSWKAPLVSMSNGKTFCGGATIGERYVLTAAHCTTKIPKNQILVRLGQHDSSGEDFAVTEIKRHAQYNPRTMVNDIALLKLGRSVKRYKNIGSVCLPKETNDKDAHNGTKGILLGWQGILGENSGKAELLEIMANEDCKKKLKVNVPDSMLCTEARNEDGRTCNADSGAPLVIEDDGRYEVIGILSWNRNDCDQRFPSTFSRVSSYLGWIRKHAV